MSENPNRRQQHPHDPTEALTDLKLLTVRELAALLGLHEKTIYDWAARGQLPCVRLGNRLRFDPADITRWVSARREGV
jgi:putative molybdopterin biosynthesis protein